MKSHTIICLFSIVYSGITENKWLWKSPRVKECRTCLESGLLF